MSKGQAAATRAPMTAGAADACDDDLLAALPRPVRRMLRRARRDGVLRFAGSPFSNFKSSPIVLPDPHTGRPRPYQTVEHRYQAMRARNAADHAWVADAPDAAEAKMRGRSLGDPPGWERDRERHMLEALRAKWRLPDFRDLLLLTGDLPIVEDRDDPVWGRGPDGEGQNLLGRMLEQVRDEIAHEAG